MVARDAAAAPEGSLVARWAAVAEWVVAAWAVGVSAYYYWELGFVRLAAHLLGVGA